MFKDAKGSFDAQQRLLSLGVPQRGLTAIREFTLAERRVRTLGIAEGYRVDPHFFGGNRGLFSGNYQERIVTDLGYPPPQISITTETPVQKGLLRRRTEIQTNSEVKEIKPVDDIAEEIASYARELSARGVHPVNIVDFGAGAAITMSKAARLLKDDIHAGKVNIYATNVDVAPTIDDIPAVRRHFNAENAGYIEEALSEGTVNFVQADIVELYEMLQGNPVHLLFMVDMLSQIDEIADPVLQIVGEMIDHQHGTAVFSFDKTRPDYPPGDPLLPKIRKRLRDLGQKGMTLHHPLRVADGSIHGGRPLGLFEFEIYRGSDAPDFKLYTV